jgi:hypothetical protein
MKCGKFLKEVQTEILKTLNDHIDDVDEESNVDIDEEEASFLNTSVVLASLAKEENATRKKQKISHNRSDNSHSKDLPVLFDSSIASTQLEDCNARSCDICRHSIDTQEMYEKTSDSNVLNYQYIDKEEEEVLHFQNVRSKNGHRQSRTALISMQKKASVRLLNEIFNSLTFIEKYNIGFQKKSVRDCFVENNYGEPACTTQQVRRGPCGQRRTHISRRASSQRAQIASVSDQNSPSENVVVRFEPLSHLRQMFDNIAVRGRRRQLQRMSLKYHIEHAIDEIASVLRSEAVVLNRFATDASIIAEEKALNRAMRNYSRMADQEKIEKKSFVEKQRTLLLESNYSKRKRKRAESPQGTDWKQIQSRLCYFVGIGEKMPHNIHACPFGTLCPICSAVFSDDGQYRSDTIFNPCFRTIKDQDRYMNHRQANEEKLGGRTGVCEVTKTTATLKLSELYRTFHFIAKYNKGMITTRDTSLR